MRHTQPKNLHQQSQPRNFQHSGPRSAKRRGALSLSVLAVASLALAGCSVADQNDQGTESSDESASNGTVTIMTHDSFNISEELVQKFEDESGYTLTTTAPGDAGAVVNQLLLQQDNPTVDGVYGIDSYSTYPLFEADLLQDYEGDLPEGAEQLLVEESRELIPIDQGQVCVNADLNWFAEQDLELPETLEDLADPNYENLFVTTDPNSSSPGLAFLVATHTEFDTEVDSYWEDLFDNGVRIASGWSDAYYTDFSGSDGQGDYPLVLSYSSSPSAEGGDTASIEGTCTPQVEYAGVIEGSANPEGAHAFIEFLLQEEFQTELIEGMYMYPVDENIELPEEWAEHASLTDDPIEPDLAEVAEQRQSWLQSWTQVYETAN